MESNREIIENRILKILTYIDNKNLASNLKQNLSLFSLEELNKMLGFLETWNYEIIYNIIAEKFNEYKDLLNQFKMIKISQKRNLKLNEEQNERKKESEELNLLLNFE